MTRPDHSQVPKHLHSAFPIQANNLVISHAHSESPSERVREVGYRLYHVSNPQQEQILQTMISKRKELAEICGYKSFAHRAVLESLAQVWQLTTQFILFRTLCTFHSFFPPIFFLSRTVMKGFLKQGHPRGLIPDDCEQVKLRLKRPAAR